MHDSSAGFCDPQSLGFAMPFEQTMFPFLTSADTTPSRVGLPSSYPYSGNQFNNFQHMPHLYSGSASTQAFSGPTTTSVFSVPATLMTANNQIFSGPAPVSGSAPVPIQSVHIENACLAFIRSLMYRESQEEVIKASSINFGWDEIKDAREVLYRKTGTIKYRPSNDQGGQGDKGKHCVASIIAKLVELEKRSYPVTIGNSAADLFRLANMVSNSGAKSKLGYIEMSGASSIDERRLSRISINERRITCVEADVHYLKSLPHNRNPAATPTPRVFPDTSKRQNLLNSLNVSDTPTTPNKRRRTGEFIAKESEQTSLEGSCV